MNSFTYEEMKEVVGCCYGAELFQEAAEVSEELSDMLRCAADDASETESHVCSNVTTGNIVAMASGLAIVFDAIGVLSDIIKDFESHKKGIMKQYFMDAILDRVEVEGDCEETDTEEMEEACLCDRILDVDNGAIERGMAEMRKFFKEISDSGKSGGEEKKRVNITLEVS